MPNWNSNNVASDTFFLRQNKDGPSLFMVWTGETTFCKNITLQTLYESSKVWVGGLIPSYTLVIYIIVIIVIALLHIIKIIMISWHVVICILFFFSVLFCLELSSCAYMFCMRWGLPSAVVEILSLFQLKLKFFYLLWKSF